MKQDDNNKSFITKIVQFINEEIYDFSGRKNKTSESHNSITDERKEKSIAEEKPFKEMSELPEKHDEIGGRVISLHKTHESNLSFKLDKENDHTKVFDALVNPHLILIKGFLSERKFPLLEAETTLGRSNANTIVLSDKSVSRNHAKIVKKAEQFYIYDLESTNGVIINGEQVKEAQLKNNDTVVIGEFSFEFIEPSQKRVSHIPQVIEVRKDDPEIIAIGEQPPQGFLYRLIPPEKRWRIILIIGFFSLVSLFIVMNQKSKKTLSSDTNIKDEDPHSREKEKRFQFTVAQGKDLLEKEHYEEALQAFIVALKLDPTNPDVLRYKKKAAAAIELQKEISAEKEALKTEEQREARVEKMEREGMNFYNQYSYAKAQEVFEKLLKEDPDNSIANKYIQLIKEITSSAYKEKLKIKEEQELVKEQIELAQGLYEKGDIYKALTEMRKVFNFDVDLSQYRDKIQARIETWEKELKEKLKEKLEHAKTLWENGEKKEARTLLQEILKEYPDYPDAREEYHRIQASLTEEAFKYYNEGRIYEYNDDMKAAIENYEKVINLLDRNDEYYKKAEEQLRKIR